MEVVDRTAIRMAVVTVGQVHICTCRPASDAIVLTRKMDYAAAMTVLQLDAAAFAHPVW